MQRQPAETKSNCTRRTVAAKLVPFPNYFARIFFVLKQSNSTIDQKEFQFALASAIKAVHGDIANQVDVLNFIALDSCNYKAIIRFKTVHYTRVITSLLLYGNWNNNDCRFDIDKVVPTLCLLSQP